MPKSKGATYETFDEISGRLDEIIGVVRDKDTSLEHALDLFDEALSLGSAAIELVDTTNFSPEEELRLAESETVAPLNGEQNVQSDSEA